VFIDSQLDMQFVADNPSPLSSPESPRKEHTSSAGDGEEDNQCGTDSDADDINEELFLTPRTVRSTGTIGSVGTDGSMLSLTDIEHELHEIIAKVNSGQEYDEKHLDRLIHLQSEHPEHQARQLQELQEWTNSVEDYLAECLVMMRTFVPVNIACSSKDQLVEENMGLSADIVRRVHEKKCLWLCRLGVDDIDRLHDIELRDRYNPTAENLDIVELSAVYAAFPEQFSSDRSGKKTELKLAIMHLLQRLLKQREDGELPAHKLRHPAYGSDEYGPIEDITSTYTTRVVSGISSDEYSGLVAPRRSFHDVCGRHSILSMRKAPEDKNFTNVFAQYSGPDLVHAGWLKKETGKVLSLYQSRYCVLTGSDKMLRYFKREDDIDTQGTCDLSLVVKINPEISRANPRSSLSGNSPSPAKTQLVAGSATRFQLINNTNKIWTFQASSVDERELWLEHINFVMRAVPDTSRVSIVDSGGSGKYNGLLSFGSPGSGGGTPNSHRQTPQK